MRNSKLTRVIALLLGIMMMSCLGLSVCAVSLPTGTSAASGEDSTTAEALEILGDDKWTEYKEKYGSYPNYEGEPIVIEEGRDCSEVLIQLSAVKSEITGVSKVILKEHIGHCIVDAVHENDDETVRQLLEAIDKLV